MMCWFHPRPEISLFCSPSHHHNPRLGATATVGGCLYCFAGSALSVVTNMHHALGFGSNQISLRIWPRVACGYVEDVFCKYGLCSQCSSITVIITITITIMITIMITIIIIIIIIIIIVTSSSRPNLGLLRKSSNKSSTGKNRIPVTAITTKTARLPQHWPGILCQFAFLIGDFFRSPSRWFESVVLMKGRDVLWENTFSLEGSKEAAAKGIIYIYIINRFTCYMLYTGFFCVLRANVFVDIVKSALGRRIETTCNVLNQNFVSPKLVEKCWEGNSIIIWTCWRKSIKQIIGEKSDERNHLPPDLVNPHPIGD